MTPSSTDSVKHTGLLAVSFSAAQLAECQHKAAIVCEEQDLQDSYEVTLQQAEALRDLLYVAKPGSAIALTVDQAELLAGELENAAEIDDCNAFAGDESSVGSARSMRDGVRRLRAAIAKAQGGDV